MGTHGSDSLFYRRRAAEEALGLMAQAVQSNPDNEELAMDAFIQYLRVNDQKAAQQVCRFLLAFPWRCPPATSWSCFAELIP